MKRSIYFMLLLVMLFVFPHNLIAADLPLTLEDDDWRLIVDTADADRDRLCQPGDVEMYELKLENVSENKQNVTMHTFRQEKDEHRDDGLAVDEAEMLAANASLEVRNLPVPQNIKALDVLILWQEEADGQYFKQHFMVPFDK
ncbi:hypothetical protein EPH95_16605 [Salicibibacter halophilus]|uniref:DUF4352 domain-containing protein n=1 Tax=Salicibibacter halophilus TaxID=2502791 RepID=A0A514LMX1_9BACI|nr:hypothetical protein [Salicibibacter halophilus]QDI92601.1 hypothetical protein EPH95_16605 [Salicibibacter halophilus]